MNRLGPGLISYVIGWKSREFTTQRKIKPILEKLEERSPVYLDYGDIVRGALNFKKDYSGFDDLTWHWRWSWI